MLAGIRQLYSLQESRGRYISPNSITHSPPPKIIILFPFLGYANIDTSYQWPPLFLPHFTHVIL
jgi:hypothetical protein